MILGFAAVGFIAYRRKTTAATTGAFVMPFAAAAARCASGVRKCSGLARTA
jgi:hypothetical protein